MKKGRQAPVRSGSLIGLARENNRLELFSEKIVLYLSTTISHHYESLFYSFNSQPTWSTDKDFNRIEVEIQPSQESVLGFFL